jgi:hypothetical protein
MVKLPQILLVFVNFFWENWGSQQIVMGVAIGSVGWENKMKMYEGKVFY